jgi:uncharacterized protein
LLAKNSNKRELQLAAVFFLLFPAAADYADVMTASPIRWLWFAAGWVCVGLGFIGAVLPIMPSTVFFVAAAACFARSSPRFEAWVLNLPGVGQLVRDYRTGLGMKHRTKIWVVCIIFLACAISAWRAPPAIAKIAAGGLGIVGIWYIWTRVPTRELVEAKLKAKSPQP